MVSNSRHSTARKGLGGGLGGIPLTERALGRASKEGREGYDKKPEADQVRNGDDGCLGGVRAGSLWLQVAPPAKSGSTTTSTRMVKVPGGTMTAANGGVRATSSR